MGEGLCFRCQKCGEDFTAYTGIGFSFPRVYQDVVAAIQKGKYGKEWKKLFKATPGAAVNAEQELFVCPDCGRFDSFVNLSLYAPKEPGLSKFHDIPFSTVDPCFDMEYVMPRDLETDYQLVKQYPHVCQKCGKEMKPYSKGKRMKCPRCNDGWLEQNPAGRVLWD